MSLSLNRVPVGKTAVVTGLRSEGAIRRRLMDLGFIPGASLACLYAAPGGDPRAYGVQGTVIALRNADAASIHTVCAQAQGERP